MSQESVGSEDIAYNSSTQPHPTVTFNLRLNDAPPNPVTYPNAYLKFESYGLIEFEDTYFEPPASTGWYTFTFQADAGSLDSGRYFWFGEFAYYDADGDPDVPLNGEDDFFAFQDVINRDNSEFGSGWQLPELDRLVVDQDLYNHEYSIDEDGVSLITGDNHAIWFKEHDENLLDDFTDFAREPGNPYSFAELLRDDTNFTYILTDIDGSKSVFDIDGMLLSREDRLGNVMRSYTYSGSLLESITDASGSVTHYGHDSNGLVTSVTDFYETPGAQTTTLEYSGGHLTEVTQPDPDGVTGPLSSPVTNYEYYDIGNPAGLLKSVVDPRGLQTDIEYDFTRHVNKLTERCGGEIEISTIAAQTLVNLDEVGDSPSNLAALIPAGVANTWDITTPEHRVVYGQDQYIKRNANSSITSFTDEDTNVTLYTYNYVGGSADPTSFGLLSTVIQPNPDGDGPLSTLTTTYEYDVDDNGKPIRLFTDIYHPIGSEHWEYDGTFGQVTSYIDALDHLTWYDVDPVNGNVLKMTQVLGEDDREEPIDDPADLTTEYTYTDGLGTTTIKGLVETVTDPNENVTHYTYNTSGLVDTIVYAEETLDEVTELYEYDDRDRLQFFTDGRSKITEYVYDNLDRLIQRIDSDPDGEELEYESPIWQYYYDPSGNQTHVIDPMGNDTEYVYDVRDRPIQVIQHNGFVPPPIAAWNLDETEGTIAADATYNGHVGAVTGTESWVSDAGHDGFEFDGATKIVAAVPMGEAENVSIAAWANLEAADIIGSNLVSWGSAFSIWMDNSSGTTATMYNGSSFEYATVNDSFEGEGWHFFVATFDDDEGYLRLYVDGELVASASTASSIDFYGSDVVVGQDGNSEYFDFTGMVDDVGVYDYALTAAQVAELYEPGPITQTDYDCNGNLVRAIDPLNHVTEYDYDDLNRLITRTDPDPDGAEPTYVSPVTQYTYNSLGWLMSMTDPEDNVTFYQYDAMGRQTKEVKVTGTGLTGEYRDDMGEVVHTRVDDEVNFEADSDFAGFSDLPDSFLATWSGAIYFDFETDPSREVTFYLDSTDSSELLIDGQSVVVNSGTGTDVGGSATLLTAGWHTVAITFDDDHIPGDSGLIASYNIGDGELVIPVAVLGTTQVTSYTYDNAGNLETLTDPNGNTTTWDYDDVNRVTSETIVIDPEPLTRNYIYEGSDLVQKTDRNGRVTRYEYDALHRLEFEKWYTNQAAYDTSPNSPLRTIGYTYDDVGNLLSIDDPDASYEFEYDDLNRQTDADQTIDGLAPTIGFDRTYDQLSRLTSTSTSIGSTADYRNSYMYDAFGRMTTLTQASQLGGNAVSAKRVDLGYHADGQVASTSRWASASQSNPVAGSQFTYDDAGRVRLIDHVGTAFGSTFVEEHDYGYDRANRVVSHVNYGQDSSYSYDALGQLTYVVNDATPHESYWYDAGGNRTATGVQTYATEVYNRLVSDGTYTYTYDDEGNVILRDSIADDTYTVYTWDHRNRLVKVEYSDENEEGHPYEYSYDVFNQLVATRYAFDDNDWRTVFVHDDGQMVLEFFGDRWENPTDLAGTDLTHRYLWGDAVDQLLADEQVDWGDSDADGEILWALTDRQGSVTDLVDNNGDLRIHRLFDGFGNIVGEQHYNTTGSAVTSSQAGYVDEAFAYTGRLFDKDTGLQNNLNRWYDPAIGRWMSEDPIGFAAGDANLYRYVGNSPTNNSDPTGFATIHPPYPQPQPQPEPVYQNPKPWWDIPWPTPKPESCDEPNPPRNRYDFPPIPAPGYPGYKMTPPGPGEWPNVCPPPRPPIQGEPAHNPEDPLDKDLWSHG